MDKESAKTMTSPCGLPCFHCPVHLAKENPEIREKLAAMLGVEPEKASCSGCRSQMGRISFLNAEKTCRIYSCAQEKDIDFCHECDDFPCDRFQPYADQAHLPHNTKMYQLCMMKKLGFEKWAAEHAVKIWEKYGKEPFDFKNILY